MSAHDTRSLKERLEWICNWSEPDVDLADAGTCREALDRFTELEVELDSLKARIAILEDELREERHSHNKTWHDLAAVKAERDGLQEALQSINRKASPTPEPADMEALVEVAALILAPHLEGGRGWDQMPPDRAALRQWARDGMCNTNDATRDDALEAAHAVIAAIHPAIFRAGEVAGLEKAAKVIAPYPESYRTIGRIGDGSVACASVAADIEYNMLDAILALKGGDHGA